MVPLIPKHAAVWLSAGLASCLVAGGGGGAATSQDEPAAEATVHGQVTIRGTPARGGTIYFDPTTASRPSAPVASAKIGSDGNYTIKTLVGENRVNVEAPETRKDAKLSEPQPLTVQGGDNTINVRIPPG